MKKAELCLICRATLKDKGSPSFDNLQFSFAPRTYEVILENQKFDSCEPVSTDVGNGHYYLRFLATIFFADGIPINQIVHELHVQVTSPEIVECELWDFELLSHP